MNPILLDLFRFAGEFICVTAPCLFLATWLMLRLRPRTLWKVFGMYVGAILSLVALLLFAEGRPLTPSPLATLSPLGYEIYRAANYGFGLGIIYGWLCLQAQKKDNQQRAAVEADEA